MEHKVRVNLDKVKAPDLPLPIPHLLYREVAQCPWPWGQDAIEKLEPAQIKIVINAKSPPPPLILITMASRKPHK